jgi:hypothetical protein
MALSRRRRSPSRLPLVGGLAIQLALFGVLTSAVAFAAGLGLTAEDLTVSSGPTSVPLTTCSVGAAADAYVYELNGGTNFGGATTLDVRSELQEGILILPDTPANKRTLVRFDLSACSIPSGASIQSAALQLFLSTAPGADRTYDAYRVTSAWTEGGVTWGTRPSTAAGATATTTTGTTAGLTRQWGVSADVQAYVNGTATNHGWLVRDRSEGALQAQEGRFQSREAAGNQPLLAISYYP